MPLRTEKPAKKPTPEASPGDSRAVASPGVQEHWLELAGGRMRYLKTGSGPALILVHGLLGYSFSWRFALPALAPHATTYAIDNLGAGLSVAPKDLDCSARATAERILQFADALGILEFDLLGTSHGGGVAMMAAALCAQRRDARIRRLILVAPVNPWSRHGRLLAPLAASAIGAPLVRTLVGRRRVLDRLWLRRMFGDVSKIPADSLDGYRIPVRENHSHEHALRIVSSWTSDMKELERSIPLLRDYPTMLMWGTKDRMVYFRSAGMLRRAFRSVRLVTFDGAGHLPYEEAPQGFNRALVEFLNSTAVA